MERFITDKLEKWSVQCKSILRSLQLKIIKISEMYEIMQTINQRQ